MARCYSGLMPSPMLFHRSTILLLFTCLLSACGAILSPVATPPSVCAAGQVSTESEPCVARPATTDTAGESAAGETTEAPNESDDTAEGDAAEDAPLSPSEAAEVPQTKPVQFCPTFANVSTTTPRVSSVTTLRSCYAPGVADAVFVSFKLEDSTVTLVKPILVFDIVRVNADQSTTSVAHTLLDARPATNPNFLQRSLTKEELLAGLEASVALRFKTAAPVGKYVMAISLFKNTNAYDPNNLVGRVFYTFEITARP
jgi:hypothetical protein